MPSDELKCSLLPSHTLPSSPRVLPQLKEWPPPRLKRRSRKTTSKGTCVLPGLGWWWCLEPSVLGAEAWTPWLSGLSSSGVCGTERCVGWQLSWLRMPGTLCGQLLVALVCLSPKDASAQTCIQGGFLTPGNFFFLWAKFYLGQKEGCSLGGSTSDSSERLLQRGYWGGQYIRFRGRGSSMQSNTYFTRGFLLLDTFEAQSLLPSQLSWFWLSNAFLISLQLFIIYCVIHMATLLCILVHCWYWWKKINSQSEKQMENCIPVSLSYNPGDGFSKSSEDCFAQKRSKVLRQSVVTSNDVLLGLLRWRLLW